MELVICQVEKLVVATEVAPPPKAIPTATHVVDVAQDRDASENTPGWASWVQVFPFVVPIITGLSFSSPIATQVVASEQDTLDKSLVDGGGLCELQLEPSTVSAILPPPTAVHWAIVKHEID
jgi:hypothetical protein